jgi:hypothetical protein
MTGDSRWRTQRGPYGPKGPASRGRDQLRGVVSKNIIDDKSGGPAGRNQDERRGGPNKSTFNGGLVFTSPLIDAAFQRARRASVQGGEHARPTGRPKTDIPPQRRILRRPSLEKRCHYPLS